MASAQKLIFEKEGVFIHTTIARVEEDALVAGKIFIWDKPEGIFVEWKDLATFDPNQVHGETDWTMVDSVGYKKDKTQDAAGSISMQPKRQQTNPKYVINYDIKDLKSFKRSRPSLGWSYLIFILKDGTTYPALHFHQGGTKLFIKELEKHLIIKKSPTDPCLYLVREHDPQALTKSFDELHLFGDHSSDMITRFIRDPYTTTWGGFSKVTSFISNIMLAPPEQFKEMEKRGVTEHLQEDLGIKITEQDEPGYEMITRVELPPRKTVSRGLPLTSQQWSQHMDQEGRVKDVDELKEIIFNGGVEPSIRIDIWKFLLGYYAWSSTYQSRTEQRRKRVDDYFRMKLQWKSVSEEQEKRFSHIRDRKSLIDKDVTRTDRTHPFFQGDSNPNIMVLNDILMTYCMYNFDLGYVQGMSDLLAPILVVMENEVDAFWCFAGFMELVCLNFEMDQAGMKRQLRETNQLLCFLDVQLYNHLESQESSNMYFCFRWLLIIFKREFTFPDIMRLWEVYWTGLPCYNFHLLMCLSILDKEKSTIIENNFGFTEILKHINDMSLTMDVDEVLCGANSIYRQLADCKELPESISEIIGLHTESDLQNTTVRHRSKSNSPTSPHITCKKPSQSPDLVVANGHVNSKSTSQNSRTACDSLITPVTADDSSIEILSDHMDVIL